jgi:hypothetical protein
MQILYNILEGLQHLETNGTSFGDIRPYLVAADFQ